MQIRNTIENTVSIFIIPPSFNELKKRLTLRGLDLDEVIKKRLENAKEELKQAEFFDYIILNDNFDNAIEELSSIIFSENYEYNSQNNLNILKDLLD